MSIAAKAKYRTDDSVKAIQNQTVNVNVSQQPPPQPTTIINNAARPSSVPVQSVPEVIERDVELDLEPEEPTQTLNSQPVTVNTTPSNFASNEPETDIYQELETLHAMVSNYETVSKALILIIELYMSNPLVVNKIIIPTEDSFKDLVKTLTSADDVEIRYSEEVTCSLSNKKYRLVEDIIVVMNTEPKSLKYSHPDVIRLFDRFNISVKMISKKC